MKSLYILLLFAIGLAACTRPTVRRTDFSVHGIDVSHYQDKIDWKKIAAQDVQFAFVKATEGGDLRDRLFPENWRLMKEAGIRRGAYHFFRPGVSAEEQAANFLSSLAPEDGDLLPVLDVEVTDGESQASLVEGVATWLRMVEEEYKVRPILYTNQKFFNRHLAKDFSDYPVWIARYHATKTPVLDMGKEWAFWQYGNRGRLQGISGDVDFNVFKGNAEDLLDYCIRRPAPLFQLSQPLSTVSEPADCFAIQP